MREVFWRSRNHVALGLGAITVAIVLVAQLGDGVTGNLAEWVGGLGTVAAFAITYRLLLEEVTGRRDDRMRQARGVSVATQTRLVGVGSGLRAAATLWLHNGSDLPITQVEALVTAPGYNEAKVLESFGEMGADRRDERIFELGAADLSHLEVFVWFVDAAGQHWRRRPNGELSPATAADRGLG